MKKNGRWTLHFFLDKCHDPKYEVHFKSQCNEPLFGHVIEGMEALNALSGTSVADRVTYTFSIEYRKIESDGRVENVQEPLNNEELIVF